MISPWSLYGFGPVATRLLTRHGWRVAEIKLAPPPEGQDELVLMPAEVEIQ